MPKVVIAGGSGFVGSDLAALLLRLNYEVVVLSRSGAAPPGARGVSWNGATVGEWAAEVSGAQAVVNLSGAPISCKWTAEAREEILSSRIRSTEAIASAIRLAETKPKVWINASAVGYYGDRGSEELTEASAPGKRKSFLVDTCVAWEATFDRADVGTDTRKCKVRIGIVLGRGGGAFPQLAKLTRAFFGGYLGSGTQYISWIHVKDLSRLLVHCIEEEMPEVMNGTSPSPVSNRFFMATMRGMMGRPWAPPVPRFALRIANWFGAPDPSLVLDSQRVLPQAALGSGFKFEFDDLRDAIHSLM